jgi:hypothetical protein
VDAKGASQKGLGIAAPVQAEKANPLPAAKPAAGTAVTTVAAKPGLIGRLTSMMPGTKK